MTDPNEEVTEAEPTEVEAEETEAPAAGDQGDDA